MKKNLLTTFLIALLAVVGGVNAWGITVTETYDFGGFITANGAPGMTLGTDVVATQSGASEYTGGDLYMLQNPTSNDKTLELNERFAIDYGSNAAQNIRFMWRSSSNAYQHGLAGNWNSKGAANTACHLSILNLKAGDKVTMTWAVQSGKAGQPYLCKSGIVTGVDADAYLANNTEYTIAVDGNLDLYFKNNNFAVSKIVIVTEKQGEEAMLAPSIDITGVNGTARIVTITPGVGEAGTAATATYYTTDGSEPSSESIAYTAPFSVAETTTIKAVSYLNTTKGAVASKEIVTGTEVALNKPTWKKTAYDAETAISTVTLTSNQNSVLGAPTAKIYYSINDAAATEYTDAISVKDGEVLSYYATADGYVNSEIGSIKAIAPFAGKVDWSENYKSETDKLSITLGDQLGETSFYYMIVNEAKITEKVLTDGSTPNNFLQRTNPAGIYSGTKRSYLIPSAKAGQYITITTANGGETANITAGKNIAIDEWNTISGKFSFFVTGDTAQININRYCAITSITVQKSIDKAIFLKPGLWNADGARYAAYTWNDNGNKWFDFVPAAEEGIFTAVIPESYTGLIVARMKGDAVENNWDNKWNQTADINFAVVTDSTLFTITGWNASDFETSKYEKAEPVLNTYTATFTTNAGWEKVYAYVWTGEGLNKVLGDWPGTELTANEGVYNVTIEAETAPEKIIFNSGAGAKTEDLDFENGKAYEFNVEDSELMAQAKTLAADAEAVAVGKLTAAIAAAQSTGDESNLQAAIDQFKADNADVEKDETAKVKTDGWKKFDGSAAGVCATQFAPAIDTYDGRKDVKLAESYQDGNNGDVQTTGTIIYQDITGLANGSYKVGFYGNAFFTSGRGFESTMEDGATDVAYVFANDQKEFITARIATSTTENNFRQFDVEVTDGTIKLGMGKEKPGTNWHTMQIYQLTWFTTAKAAYAAAKAEMKTEIAAAKALKTESRTAGVDDFNAAIEAAEATLTSNMLNVTEFENEVANLKAAAAAFKKANWYIDFAAGEYYIIDTEGGKMMAAGHDYGTRGIVNEMGLDLTLTPYTESRTVTIDSRVANGNNHFLGENLYMDSSEWGWALEYQGFGFYILEPKSGKYINLDDKDNLVLSDTPREFIIVTKEGVMAQRMEELAAATAENPVDATFLIQGANFNRNDQRNSAWTVSEDCTNKNLSGGADANRCAESYHSTFTISQAISGAPAGKYTLTAQGFFRQDKNANEVDTVETTPIFFIGDKTAEVPAKTGTEDNMKQASESFTAGQYTIEPIEFVYNGEGDLVVGIKNETAKYQWIIFDNFQLTYYGAKAEEPVEIEKFYIMGTATTNEWNNTTEMTYNEETQAFEYTVENSDKLYVTFGDAEFTNWDDFNANHRYAIGSDNQDATIGEAMQLLKVNGTLVLAAGKYNISVTKSLLCTITKVEESSYNSNVTYALEEGDTFKSGQAVEVKNNDVVVATITYGEAGDGAEDFKAAKADGSVEGFAAFTEGNGVNGNKACGTFYTIVPNYDGEIAIAVVLNADKAFYVEEDGTALEAYNGIKVSEKYYGTYTFNVTANKAYKVYCAGSKLGFYGFNYKYNAEVTPEPEKIESMYIMGELTGGWDFTDSQKMTQDAENAAVWTLTVEGFEAEAKTYKYKATANAKWGVYELPASGDYTFTFGTEEFPAGKYNLLFTVNTTDGTLTLVPTKVVPDGINSIAADRMNGTIYNLNGQKVLKAQKGMYIINGKKVVKK